MSVAMPLRRALVAATLAAAVLAAGCQSMPGTMSGTMPAKPLYERLGGQPAVIAVVDDFVANVAGDARINRRFAGTDIPRLKRLLVEQICAGTGGPCRYTGRDMKSAHQGMAVTDAEFGALVEDLVKTLDKFNVPKSEQGELLAILGPMKPDVVGQ